MATSTTEETGAVTQVTEKGGELVSAAQEQVAAKTSEIREDAVFQIREQLAERSDRAGHQVQAVAQALRSGGQQLRTESESSAANVVENLAKQAEQLGEYLRTTDPDRMLGDVEDFARRRPWLVAGCAALAGLAASRLLKASSDRRYEMNQGGLQPSERTPLTVPVGR
ncbi:MAG TPA: hypothetical protein VFV56_07170 [Gaiellaceae bacterium]|nr:hypothetical protein [Gaiellaceae bacterium]